MAQNLDVCIRGGGMVGRSLALLLAGTALTCGSSSAVSGSTLGMLQRAHGFTGRRVTERCSVTMVSALAWS